MMAADASKKNSFAGDHEAAVPLGSMTIHLVSPAVYRARSVNKKYERMKRSPSNSGGRSSGARQAAAGSSGSLSSVARRLLLNKIAAQSGPRAGTGACHRPGPSVSADSAFSECNSAVCATEVKPLLNSISADGTTHSDDLQDSERCDHARNGCIKLSQLGTTFHLSDSHIRSSLYEEPSGIYCLIVSRDDRYSTTSAGPVETPRLCIKCDSKNVIFSFQVFYKSIHSGPYDGDFVKVFLSQLHPKSYYVVCPGLQSYPDTIQFKTKNVRFWGEPFGRIDSEQCILWHIPNNTKQSQDSQLYNCCSNCKRLHHDIQQLLKRALTTTNREKESRKAASSNYPLKYLSPSDRNERIVKKTRKRRRYMTNKLTEIVQVDHELNRTEIVDKLETEIRGVSSSAEGSSHGELERSDSEEIGERSECNRDAEERTEDEEEHQTDQR